MRTTGPRLSEEAVRHALEETRGHKAAAARVLDVSRMTLWRAMQHYRIPELYGTPLTSVIDRPDQAVAT